MLMSIYKSSSSPKKKMNFFKQNILLNVKKVYSFSWLSSNGRWSTQEPQPICGGENVKFIGMEAAEGSMT